MLGFVIDTVDSRPKIHPILFIMHECLLFGHSQGLTLLNSFDFAWELNLSIMEFVSILEV